MATKITNLIDDIKFSIKVAEYDTEDFCSTVIKETYIVESYFEDRTETDCFLINIYINDTTEENLCYKGRFNTGEICDWEEIYCDYDIENIKDLAIDKTINIIKDFR